MEESATGRARALAPAPALCNNTTPEVLSIMMLQIVLTITIIFVLGLAFALTSLKLGRGDKRPGCGHGTCSACNPANRDTACPTQTGTDSGPLTGAVDEPEYDRIADGDPAADSREEWDTDTDVHIRPAEADPDKKNEQPA